MVNIPPKMKKRQITLGVALDGFEVEPQSPVSSSVDVATGALNNHSSGQEIIQAAQAVGPFASVSAINKVRWDLVYLDETGTALIEQGAEQNTPIADYTGAPGNGAPFSASDVLPLAYVKVDESGGVIIDPDDITDLRGFLRMGTKGVVGSLATDNNAGATGVLGTNWNLVPIDHQHPPNVDAVNPADVDVASSPGASFIYARRDHVHKIEAALLASLGTPLAKSSNLLWTPYTFEGGQNPSSLKWVLHQFQGRAFNDDSVWFDVAVGTEELLTLFPVNVGGDGALGANVQLGGADETNPGRAGLSNSWLFVYLLGNPNTGDAALVYSTNAPSVGPSIGVNPAFSGYTAYRCITALEMFPDPAPYPCAMVKMDNHVFKMLPTADGDHGVTLLWSASTSTTVDLTEHVSPLAIAVFLNARASARYSGGSASRATANLYHDNAAGNDLNSPTPGPSLSDHIKNIEAEANAIDEDSNNNDGFWFVNGVNARRFILSLNIVNHASFFLRIVAYVEVTDLELSARDWDI